MSSKDPRLVEVKATFQTLPKGTKGDYRQFGVRAFLSEGQLSITWELHGEGEVVEDLDLDLIEAVKTAMEKVRGRVKPEELHEQVE